MDERGGLRERRGLDEGEGSQAAMEKRLEEQPTSEERSLREATEG